MADGSRWDKQAPAAGPPALGAALWASQGRRLALWTPVLFGLGVQIYFLWPVEPGPAALLLAAAAPVTTLLAAQGRGLGALLLATAALAVGLGFATAGARARVVAAPALAGPVEALVEGRIAGFSQSAAGRPRLLLDAPRIWGLDPAATPARVRVTLLSVRHAEGLAPGDHVSVMARLSPPGGPVEPGGFDFARAAWFERLGAVGVARSRVARLDATQPEGALVRARIALDRERARLSAGLRAALPGEAGAFAAAVVTGDRAALPVAALAALRDSNLAHLLAISGLHMAIVAGMTFFVARLGLALVPGLALRRPVKAWAAVAGLAAATAYLAVSGAAIATQRAYVMVAVAFLAMMVGRPAVTLRALAVAALIVLALRPESLLGAGFQLSFAATLALVAAYEEARARGWLSPQSGFWRRLGGYALGVAATSLIAGLATAPFAAFHFNRATSFGLLANLAAVPAMGLIVAPALAVAGLLAPFGLEGPALAAARAGVEWILAVARFVAALPGAARPVAAAPPAALWAVALGGLWLCLWRGRGRLAGLAPLALGIGLMALPPARPPLLLALSETRAGAAAVVVGALTAGGRAVAGPPGAGFVVESWLRRDGDDAEAAQAAARADFAEDRGWRVVPFDGGVAHVALRSRPAGAEARCASGAVVIAPGPAPAGDCLSVEPEALRGGGAAILAGPRLATAGGSGRLWRP